MSCSSTELARQLQDLKKQKETKEKKLLHATEIEENDPMRCGRLEMIKKYCHES